MFFSAIYIFQIITNLWCFQPKKTEMVSQKYLENNYIYLVIDE